MSDATGSPHRTLTIENRDLRQQLSEAQDLLVETAIDAGHLHERIAALQDELRVVRAERDALLTQGMRRSAPAGRDSSTSHSDRDPSGTALYPNG